MNRKFAGLAVCLLGCLMFAPGMAASETDPLAELKTGVPRPVGALIERIVSCHHWAGEEPYDAARRAEINEAIRDLRCRALERDEKRIQKTYGKDEQVRRRLEKVKAEAR